MADEVATDPGAAAPTVTQPQNDVPADAQRPQTIEAAVDNIVDPPAPTVDEVTPQPAVDPTTPAEDVLPGTTAPPVTDDVVAPAPATEEPEDEEYVPPVQTVSPIDPKAFVDENGYVDVNKLTEAFNSSIANVQQTAS